MRRREGFTLVEVLTALVITAMFSAAVYAIFLGALVDGKAARTSMEASRRGTAVLRILEKDLLSCLPQDGGWIHFLGNEEAGGGSRLELVTAVDPRTAPAGEGPEDVTRVVWRTEPGEGSLLRLFREEAPGGGRSEGGETFPRLLDDRVKEFHLEYSDGAEWRSSWSGAFPPRAVRVRLVLVRKIQFRPSSPPAEKEFSFEDFVAIPAGEGRVSRG